MFETADCLVSSVRHRLEQQALKRIYIIHNECELYAMEKLESGLMSVVYDQSTNVFRS